MSASSLAKTAAIEPRYWLPAPRELLAPSHPLALRLLRDAHIGSRYMTASTVLTARASPQRRTRQPRPKPSLAQEEQVEQELLPDPSEAQQPSKSRAFMFLLGFSTLSFAGAAYYSLIDTSHIASESRGSRDVFANISTFLSGTGRGLASQSVWGPGITEKQLMAAKAHETATKLGVRMEWLVGWCQQLHLPPAVTEFVGGSYIICADKYLELSASQRAVIPVVAANSLVFAAWTIASATRGGGMWQWMRRHFLHRPSSNRMHTMLTSVFSHQTFLHFLFNNMALWSIGGSALVYASQLSSVSSLRAEAAGKTIPEASATPHFLAFFATAGVFAATVSHVVAAVRFRRISTLFGVPLAQRTVGRQGSLGSSGAVYAALVMAACAFPQAQLGIIFLPFVTFPIGLGVAGMVAVDVAGIVLRWRLFDHWAHLGGAAFGWVYWHYGAQAWERLKHVLVQRLRMGATAQSQYAT